ncbi:MAG TPA: MFS transporter, partial [Ktedonobacteraceae bacterium]|nr:MFS transporter [Ktedonobacteraceae bacterium]
MAESFETHEPNAIPETETFTPSVSEPHETLSQTAAPMTTQEETIGGKLAVQPVSMAFILTLAVALLAGGLSAISIKQLLLPIQVSLIDPSNANGSFTLIASLSAALGMVASPVLGAFSDRTTGRWGRRRPWIVFGLLTLVTGLLIMAFAATIATLLLGEIVIQIGNDTLFATLNALIPDLVPPQQRRLTAAAGGIAPTFGGVIGLLLVNGLTNTRIPAQG